MTTELERLLSRFSDVLHDVPHRAECQRTTGTGAEKCTCDIGGRLSPIFNGFVVLLTELGEDPPSEAPPASPAPGN